MDSNALAEALRRASRSQMTHQPAQGMGDKGSAFLSGDWLNPVSEFLADMTPGLGDYRAVQRGGQGMREMIEALRQGEYAEGAGKGAESLAEYLSTVPVLGDVATAAKGAMPLMAGIFAGQRARNAPLEALDRAKALREEGAAPEAVWQETGWFESPDGNWKWEIDDSGASVTSGPEWMGYMGTPDRMQHGTTASSVIEHPELYGEYPYLANYPVETAEISPSRHLSGSGSAGSRGIGSILAPNEDAFRSVGLHELQHNIQEIEGFGRGGSPEGVAGMQALGHARVAHLNTELSRLAKEMDEYMVGYGQPKPGMEDKYKAVKSEFDTVMAEKLKLLKGDVPLMWSPEEGYLRLSGEAEARAVQKRRDYTPEQRRATYPLQDYDVPVDELITVLRDTGPAEMTGWHGSPHKFDRFDMSKIGTGEGAQAYGHGLYFAENPEVAGQYRDKLLHPNWSRKLDPRTPEEEYIVSKIRAYEDEIGASPEKQTIRDWMNQDYTSDGYAFESDYLPEDAVHSALSRVYESYPKGNLYEVDIPDEAVSRMLDWDAPLSEQPEAVREAVSRALSADSELREQIIKKAKDLTGVDYSQDSAGLIDFADGMAGRELYHELAYGIDLGGNPVGPKVASENLRDLGIPGIKYFDGSSRAKGEGTRNLVVFDDSLIKILRRE